MKTNQKADVNKMKEDILRLYESEGYLTYKSIADCLGYAQGTIQKYFKNIRKLHEILGVEYVKSKIKIVKCSECSADMVVSKFVLNDFERFCDKCKSVCIKCGGPRDKVKPVYDETDRFCITCSIKENNKEFVREKDIDYVECPKCGYRSLSLEGHYRESNETWTKCRYALDSIIDEFGLFRMRCLKSDQQARQTRKEVGWYANPEYSKNKIKEWAGNHIRGKTKETSDIVRKISETRKIRFAAGEIVPHNKGKTKENYEPLKIVSDKLMEKVNKFGFWSGGHNALNLNEEDFLDFLDEKGCLKKNEMRKSLGICYASISKYQKMYDIKSSIEHPASELVSEGRKGFAAKYKISKKQLLEASNEKGVDLDKVSLIFNANNDIIRYKCKKYGLKFFKHPQNGFQYNVLELVRMVIGVEYQWEYTFEDIIWHKTGRCPRYDGYFKKINLIVEVNGRQHYEFVSKFYKDMEEWKDALKKFDFKKQAIINKNINYMEISANEEITALTILKKFIMLSLIKCLKHMLKM